MMKRQVEKNLEDEMETEVVCGGVMQGPHNRRIYDEVFSRYPSKILSLTQLAGNYSGIREYNPYVSHSLNS